MRRSLASSFGFMVLVKVVKLFGRPGEPSQHPEFEECATNQFAAHLALLSAQVAKSCLPGWLVKEPRLEKRLSLAELSSSERFSSMKRVSFSMHFKSASPPSSVVNAPAVSASIGIHDA
jgi:hypothetical protein